ncbi:hypothetical protein Indivirus_2_123 [Indivirus ILV1]|uniref:Uncharacterized protein n=1 Tax=Indivirus ILV1 TaxID=1977633 RepID=A0A1V0SDN3_9VIRU|nr:hypothetical protein Indivirus_2_123 [Indivirus ILV1]
MKKKKEPDKNKSDKEKEYEEKYRKYITSYKTHKTSLENIIKNTDDLEKINDAVYRINLIICHTYQFLKLYYLYEFHNKGRIIVIDEQLVNTTMKLFCVRDKRGKNPSEKVVSLKQKLQKFYNNHYEKLLPEKLQISFTNLSTILDYEKKNIVTCIKTHISEHFEQCINRYINVLVDKDKNMNYIKYMKHYNPDNNLMHYMDTKTPEELKNRMIINGKNVPNNKKLSEPLKKKLMSVYTKELNVLKRDIMMNEDKCNPKYNEVKEKIRNDILNNLFNDYVKNALNNGLNNIYSIIDNSNQLINGELCTDDSVLPDDLKGYIKEYNKKRADKLITDILSNNITDNNTKLVKKKLIKQYMKTSIYDKINNDPLSLLPSLIKINIALEEKGLKTMSVFPLRRSIIPKYTTIDTTTLVHVLFPESMNKGEYLTKGNLKKYQSKIWETFFNMKNKIFKNKKYQFNYQIDTDGVGCSVLLIRKDLFNPNKRIRVNHIKKPVRFRSERYVDELMEEEKELYIQLKKAVIDPGKCDLIYATDGEVQSYTKKNGKSTYKIKSFRYTQRERNQETKKRKYSKIRENDKVNTVIKCNHIDESFINYLKENGYYEVMGYVKTHKISKTVKELEDILSSANSKSCNYKKTQEYIRIKSAINNVLQEYYQKKLYRKLRWNSYINNQKSEARMINQFKKIFGNPNETIVYFGNYGGSNLKHCEPTKGKGLRKIFRNVGYRLFLVDEYNTTKKNFITGQNNEKFLMRRNPRPFKQGVKLVHGLLRSKTIQSNEPMTTGHILVNRNTNGSMNISKLVDCVLRNTPIPPYLTR